jgi:hypothetical protein
LGKIAIGLDRFAQVKIAGGLEGFMGVAVIAVVMVVHGESF